MDATQFRSKIEGMVSGGSLSTCQRIKSLTMLYFSHVSSLDPKQISMIMIEIETLSTRQIVEDATSKKS